jgi:predicted ester cyclase
MSTEQNKKLVRRFIEEVIIKRNFDLLDGVCSNDLILHAGGMGEIHGIKEFRRLNTEAGGAEAFPDFQITINDIIAESDKVMVRYTVSATHQGEFMGVLATGKKIKWDAICMYLIVDNKISEVWLCEDTLGLMMQIGVKQIPNPSNK